MQKIIINKLEPIDYCQLEIKDFTVFTGPQASGKSTVAKSIFFFKNIKNILFEQYKKKCILKKKMYKKHKNTKDKRVES